MEEVSSGARRTTRPLPGPVCRSAVSSPGRTHRSSATSPSRFGGAAGRPYDACYHQPCDTLDNVNLRVLGQMADAAAVVALRLAG